MIPNGINSGVSWGWLECGFVGAYSEAAKGEKNDHRALLRELDQRQKQVLSLFTKSKYITTREIAELLSIHPRTALNLCKKWVESEYIIQHGDANKSRKYELADKWLELV